MYRLRRFRTSDWDVLQALHEKRGFDFPIPERLAEAVVVEDEETGKVIQILGTRETRECYVWLDLDWRTPRCRWDAFEVAHDALADMTRKKGIEDAKLWTNFRGFARKLVKRLGWVKHEYPSFTLDL